MFAVLGDHLWQSTLFAVAAGLLTLILRNNRAAVRHWLWLAASYKFLVPFWFLMFVGRQFAPDATAPGVPLMSAEPQWAGLMERAAQPLSSATQSIAPALHATVVPTKASFDATSIGLAIWVCGVAAVLLIALLRWLRINRVLRTSQPFPGHLPSTSRVMLKSATTAMEPGVIGIFRPVLLLPVGISERLTPGQLQAIVSHELCHVRRRDNLTGTIHLLIEAVFWFYPPVWWIGSRILEERERACDEAVLEGGSDPRQYAEGLLHVCEHYLASRLVCAAGVSGGALKARIEVIMRNQTTNNLHVGKKALLTITAGLAIALPITVGVLHVPVARAHTPTAVANPSANAPASTAATIRMGSSESLEKMLLIDPSGRFTFRNGPLTSLISFAYGLQNAEVTGPANTLSVLYSMDAHTVTRPSQDHLEEDFRVLVQGILADRFKLSFHWETRRTSTYALLGGDKSKIKQAGLGDPGPFLQRGPNSVTGHAVPLVLFAKFVSTQLDRPILDQTGLTGTYNFKLKWGSEPGDAGVPTTQTSQPPEPSKTLLIGTMQNQLGIQLTSQDADVKYLVVDNVSQPSNAVPLPKEVDVEPAVFDLYVGHYELPGGAVMTVSREGDRFLTQLTGQPPVQIFAMGERQFFTKVVDATFRFVANDEGSVSQLVLHQNGDDVSALRMTEVEAKARMDALARRVSEQKATPGSEAALRKHLEALQLNEPNYADMTPRLAEAIRPQWVTAQQQIAAAGALESIKFTGVGPLGADIYRVHFERYTYEWRISLDSAGKIAGMYYTRVPPT
jgi:bla regulator protein blaR1